ncbi:MAG: MBL fold metallo-hydrolase [Fimbriimonas sp.]
MARLQPARDEVVVRLYNVGLGDCFLLAFPNPDASDATYVVIDCGIAKGTPDERDRMIQVVQDIALATDGEVDVLAITHEHYDHISGFSHAESEWRALSVRRLWLSWIDRDGEPEADEVRVEKKNLNKAAERATSLAMRSPSQGLQEAFGMHAPFMGVGAAGEAFGVSVMDIAYDIAKSLVAQPDFCEPGDVRQIPDTNFHAYVLGPPKHKDQDGNDLVKGKRLLLKLLEDEEEMYSYEAIGQKADGKPTKHVRALAAAEEDGTIGEAVLGLEQAKDFDRFCPFDARYRVGWEEGMVDPFFAQRYFAEDAWRRVDDEWLGAAAELALRAGDYTNNVSLVLAFALPNTGRFLLFPGDAQVGNWLSWHAIKRWNAVGDAVVEREDLTAEELLNRVSFYKVGHHGSHNATVREKGLEMMAKETDDLVAYVPVSVPVAHDVCSYCPMPFYPVMVRLKQKTNGNVYLGSGAVLDGDSPTSPDWLTVETSEQMLPAKVLPAVKGKRDAVKIEDEVPLYLQMTIRDGA